jgi:hypothetical protein
MIRDALLLFSIATLLALPAAANPAHRASSSETSDFQRDVDMYPEALLAANEVMSGSGLESNPHVYITESRSSRAGDQRRAAEILEILRNSMAKYKDYRTAIADGYQPFHKQSQRIHVRLRIQSRPSHVPVVQENEGRL